MDNEVPVLRVATQKEEMGNMWLLGSALGYACEGQVASVR